MFTIVNITFTAVAVGAEVGESVAPGGNGVGAGVGAVVGTAVGDDAKFVGAAVGAGTA